MSTKKDNSNQKDNYYMKLAFKLAEDNYGLTGENPSVGCVIVKNNELISTGKTGINGKPHAEFNAIKLCKENLRGSKIYVSLEPCTHYGKTPPCSKLIIKSKIKEVIFSIIDIDKRTANKSFKIFKKHNIKVKSGILKKEGKIFYKSYLFNKIKKLPFVTGKLAVSNDNFIVSNKKKRITNEYSDNITQLLRYRNDSILISSKTLNMDNPKLNCRLQGLSSFAPRRIILDRNLSINNNSFICSTANTKNTVIFYNKGSMSRINQLTRKGIKLIKLPINKTNFFDLKLILSKIYSLGCRNLLVEGGKNLTNSFLSNNLFNQFYLFKSSTKFGVGGKLNVTNELRKLNYIYKRSKKLNTYSDKDIIKLYSK